MAYRLRYISGTGGEEVQLDGPFTWSGTAAGILARSWSYTMGYLDVSDVALGARECSLDVSFTSPDEADRLRALADRDLSMRTPGRLVLDGWERGAYIVSDEPGTVFHRYHSSKLTVVLLGAAWRRWLSSDFPPTAESTSGGWLDLPYDVPYDLGGGIGAQFVDVPGLMPARFKMTVFGPVVDPEVSIGGNLYKLSATVPSGSRVVIDGSSWPRTIVMIGPTGDETDLFFAAERGQGEGSGSYIFEPLKPGMSEVEWSGSFGFSIEYAEEATVPPWRG